MASKCYCVQMSIFILFVLICFEEKYVSCGKNRIREPPQSSGTVQFNNPKLLGDVELNSDTGLYSSDNKQESVDPKRIGGIVIEKEAKTFSSKLRRLCNNEIGVTAMQAFYDSLPLQDVKRDYNEEINQLASKMWDKIDGYLRMLDINKMTVENAYTWVKNHSSSSPYECCNVPTSDLRWSEQHQCKITKKTSCDLFPPNVGPDPFNPGRILTEGYQHNVQYIPSIKWQYFISEKGVHNEFPTYNSNTMSYAECKNQQDIRHRAVYVSTVAPQAKNVVIMIDHGKALSSNQLKLAKEVAKHILQSLTENDRVGIIGLSSGVIYPGKDACLSKELVPLTNENKVHFSAFIDNLTKNRSATYHHMGFRKAFEMLWNTLGPGNATEVDTAAFENTMIVYISRGLLSKLTDGKSVLNSIAEENGRMGHKVVINTFAVVDEGKPIMYEKEFLTDIAAQNFTKYGVTPRFDTKPPVGQMKTVNASIGLVNTAGTFHQSFHADVKDKASISRPFRDEISKGMVVAVTYPIINDTELVGIVGLDIDMGDVFEDITYYKPDKNTYAFIIDTNGYAMMHPDMTRPILIKSTPMLTDISHYEFHKGFQEARNLMLNYDEGSHSLEIPRDVNNMTQISDLYQLPRYVTIKYLWKKVKHEKLFKPPYIVVIRTVEDPIKHKEIQDKGNTNMPKQVYHRLDLLQTDHTCMHLKQLATKDTSTLFLSANSFNHPFDHLSQEETKRMVQGYLAYLNDITHLIKNPEIKPGVRKVVAALTRINDVWLDQSRHSALNEYIVRRYVATPGGVMRMYPGTLLDKSYDPTKRDWYRRALENPGKVTLTAPYLDVGGAGYIVTISHTIYEGKNAALHGPFDEVVAVMGMDVTLGYFYKMIVDQLPVCEHNNIRCFIMDDKGYLISHQGLIVANGRGPQEQLHITHKEPLVVDDILNHAGFVRKKLCSSYMDKTVQRYYHFNSSLTGVLTNLIHGERCPQYQVTLIPGTNTFLGIVNQSCHSITAFCPCSTVDRLCLNCDKMEQTGCECPCECPLKVDKCSGHLMEDEHKMFKEDNPSCPHFEEPVILEKVVEEVSKALPPCFESKCSSRKTKETCTGVVDCEWCELDVNGEKRLNQPFCSTQRVCFAGMIGARTPYDDQISAALKEEPLNFKSTPVGPVAGGIMGCFLVLALVVYCYRHHVHRNTHHYISTVQDNGVRMSHLENEFEDTDPPDEPGAGHTNIVLATFENPVNIPSPYRVNTMYRRPVTGGESDHGYSTMTPTQGDDTNSEQASTTCVEPLIIGRDRYRPPHTMLKSTPMLPPPPSHSRRSRSPTPPQTQLPIHATIPEQSALAPAQTVIPSTIPEASPHSIIANVQVHCVDTH